TAAVPHGLEPQVARLELAEEILCALKLNPRSISEQSFTYSAPPQAAQQFLAAKRPVESDSDNGGVRDFSAANVESFVFADPLRRSLRHEASVGAVVADFDDRQPRLSHW